MRIRLPLILCCVCFSLPPTAPGARADAPPTVHLTVSQPQTPLTDVLAGLAKQTGVTILTDDTVVAPVGPTSLQADNLGEMLTKLKSLDAGLTWHKVYLPSGGPLPSGNALAQQILALQAITASGLVAVTPGESLTFTRRQDATATPPPNMTAVYLVTDEAVRAQRQAAQNKPGDTNPAAKSPATQAAAGLQGAADAFAQMTPDQQRQAIPLMFQQFQRILQAMDPRVRAETMQSLSNLGDAQGPGGAQ